VADSTRRASALFLAALLLLAVAACAPSQGRAAAAPSAPELSAEAAILVDGRDGSVLYRRGSRGEHAIASTTKLMTALLAVELLPLDKVVTAGRYRAGAAESRINLRPGERMKTADLLRALLLESANDAAATLARAAGGSVSGFVDLMNARARQLGLTETHYANPVGLDERGNHSSARDLARLARRVLRDRFLAETVDMPRARLTSGAHERVVVNRNDLVRRYPFVDGVKTGHTTDAGYVLVGAAKRKGVQLISVVLGTPSEAARDTDTLRLLNYGYGLYRRTRVARPGHAVSHARVAYYGDRRVALTPARPVTLTLRRGEHARTIVDAPAKLDGPIASGTAVGSVTVLLDGRRVARVPLVTAEKVPSAGILRKAGSWLWPPWIPLVVVAAALVWLAQRRRRRASAEAARRRRREAVRLE
jgi:D-alanyl-D-alanine carboxypeptidase (penicillin-binding protein 5/6)